MVLSKPSTFLLAGERRGLSVSEAARLGVLETSPDLLFFMFSIVFSN